MLPLLEKAEDKEGEDILEDEDGILFTMAGRDGEDLNEEEKGEVGEKEASEEASEPGVPSSLLSPTWLMDCGRGGS